VPLSQTVGIILAGLCAGAINAVVGWGTVITFPTLLAMGYPPMTSTMSNTVGLVAGSMSGAWGYRRELRGQWSRLRWQIPASLIGGGLGAWLLLHLPEKVFAEVVPVLLIAAMLLVVIGPRIQAWVRDRAEKAGRSGDHVSPRRMAALVVSSWQVAGLIAIASLIGGSLGAHYGRRLSPNALRGTIVIVGLIGLYRLLTA
jgi:hypothetical protein